MTSYKDGNKHKAGKSGKKFLAICLVLVMLAGALSGCGNGAASQTGEQGAATGDSAGAQGGTGQAADGNTQADGEDAADEPVAMGRYVETQVDISETAGRSYGITVLADGRLLIPEEKTGQLLSSDGGKSWEAKPIPGIDSMAAFTKENYIFDMAAASDGTVAVLYVKNGDYDKTGTFHPLLHVGKADGTVQTLDSLPVQGDDSFANNIYYSPEGELFVTVSGTGTVYLVDVENGTLTKVVSLEGRPDLIKFQGKYLFFLNSEEGVTIWNREEEKFVEDSVLADFMAENYLQDYYAANYYTVYVTPGEEGILYIAGKGGLYRHVIGGSAMEQIIDGALSGFSNPAMSILGVAAYGENEFAALFSTGKLALYQYDPDVPTVPENLVSVYSLREQDVVRQAIAQFQAGNPDIFVRYEVGMSGTDAKAREDAVKKLNTELMAGKGPDVIILDELPVKSYEEKGILKDLKPHIDSFTGNAVLLPNIVDAFTKDGSVYMMPVTFKLPMVAGRQENLAGITDYASLAAVAEKIKAERPAAEIGRFFSEEATMRWFLPVAATAFMEESGGINEAKLAEYLSLTDSLYTTAVEGIVDSAKETYGYQREAYSKGEYGYWHFNNIAQQSDDFFLNDMELAVGMLEDVYGYQEMLSLKYCEGLEDVEMKSFDGMSAGVFEPAVLVGLNASAGHQEDAERFFDILMGYEVQNLLYDGFTVNDAALKSRLSPQWQIFQNSGMDMDYGEVCSSLGGTTGDGREWYLEIHMPTKEEFEKLYNLCHSVKTPYLKDPVVESAVIESGAQYLAGYLSEEEAVRKIMAKVEIYMAE